MDNVNPGEPVVTSSGRNRYEADRFILVNKYRIHYLDIGQGVPILLVPSSYRTYNIWQKLIAAFPVGYRLIALDHAGIESLTNLRSTIDQATRLQTDIISGMIQQMNLGKVILTGGFYSGVIVFDLAARYPDLVDKIVLIEGDLAAPGTETKPSQEYYLKLPVPGDISLRITRVDAGKSFQKRLIPAKWYTELTAGSGDFAKMETQGIEKETGHKMRFKIELRRGASQQIEEVARSIKIPLLYIFGTKSRFKRTLLDKNLTLLKKYLPQAWVVALEGNLNDFATEKPSEVADLILEFISRR